MKICFQFRLLKFEHIISNSFGCSDLFFGAIWGAEKQLQLTGSGLTDLVVLLLFLLDSIEFASFFGIVLDLCYSCFSVCAMFELTINNNSNNNNMEVDNVSTFSTAYLALLSQDIVSYIACDACVSDQHASSPVQFACDSVVGAGAPPGIATFNNSNNGFLSARCVAASHNLCHE